MFVAFNIIKRTLYVKSTHAVTSTFFGKYLLITNTISSGSLMAIGDLIQQEIQYQRKKLPKRYDWARTGRMAIIGVCMGPWYHIFYKRLDKYFPKQDIITVLKKIAIDQSIMAPTCITCFFTGMGFLEGQSIKESLKELQSKFITVYTADWCIWPPSQFVNFYFLSPKYRVVCINLITTAYNIFLSYVKHTDSEEKLVKVQM